MSIDWRPIVADPVAPEDGELPVAIVATLGVEPSHELIHLVEMDASVRLWRVRRAQAGTAAVAWPALTPLTYLPPAQHPDQPRVTLILRQPIASTADTIAHNDSYIRAKVGSEIVHVTREQGRFGEQLVTLRGQEGTTTAAHASGAELVWLAPGEV